VYECIALRMTSKFVAGNTAKFFMNMQKLAKQYWWIAKTF
jgi:hypothetical protein